MSSPSDVHLAPEQLPCVLVVDDEELVCDLLGRWLTTEGYQCLKATDAHAAWDLLKSRPIHVVTLDVNMPHYPGNDLLVEIKHRLPDTEVVMLTAVNSVSTAIESLEHGASGYLTKPVERSEVLFQVKQCLIRQRITIENRRYTRELEAMVDKQTRMIRQAHVETVHRLLRASAYRDEETAAHVKRIGLYSSTLARSLSWSPQNVKMIEMAAPMHDIGKIAIPDTILCKPGALTDDEFAVIKQHTVIGFRILAGTNSPMLKMAQQIAHSHHERWDGTGYPSGLKGPQIPSCARIVAIADVFDALIHDRPHRPALPEAEVLQVLEDGRGTHFDPHVWDAFAAALPKMWSIADEHPNELTQSSILGRIAKTTDACKLDDMARDAAQLAGNSY